MAVPQLLELERQTAQRAFRSSSTFSWLCCVSGHVQDAGFCAIVRAMIARTSAMFGRWHFLAATVISVTFSICAHGETLNGTAFVNALRQGGYVEEWPKLADSR